MGILDKIKNVKFKTVTVKADELGEGSELIFREMSGAEQIEFNALLKKEDSDIKALSYAVMLSLVDENNVRELSNIQEAEKVVNALPAGLLQRISQAVIELNSGNTEKTNQRVHKFKVVRKGSKGTAYADIGCDGVTDARTEHVGMCVHGRAQRITSGEYGRGIGGRIQSGTSICPHRWRCGREERWQ